MNEENKSVLFLHLPRSSLSIMSGCSKNLCLLHTLRCVIIIFLKLLFGAFCLFLQSLYVEWNFLDKVLEVMGFGNMWRLRFEIVLG